MIGDINQLASRLRAQILPAGAAAVESLQAYTCEAT